MIQELLSAVVEERKLSISKGGLLSDAPSPFLPPASAGGTTIQQHNPLSSPSSTTGSDPPQQKLKCPRCDSSNTKFCYYNNYNLTQPRHFCKTCRRYWTKGGALRNVPIGGGCRKAKPIQIAAAKPSKLSKPVASSLEVITRAGFGLGPEHDFVPPIPALWAPPPPHLLALLRAGGAGIGACLADSPWRNEGQLQHYVQLPESGFGDAAGIQGMDLAAEKAVYGNGEFAASSGWSALVGGSTSMGGEFGCPWNPALSWSDMSSTN